jgi:YD repeat-containing protein
MVCPVCGFSFAESPTACPRCGSYLGGTVAGGASEPPRTFRYLLAASMVIMALLGLATYYLVNNSEFMQAFRAATNPNSQKYQIMQRERPVVHGSVVAPDQLESHGKLYFVGMGRQAFPVESLAAYYGDKFKIDVSVLPAIPIAGDAYDASRKQYVAEEMILQMKLAHPSIVRATDAVIIILTDEDVYPKSLGWKFTPSFRMDGRFAVISSRRNDPVYQKTGAAIQPQTQLAGMKRSLTKYIAMLYFHLPISSDPTSVMFQPLDTSAGGDDLYESDLHPEESANGLRGSGWPCLFYSYSYETHVIKQLSPFVQDCEYWRQPASVHEEIFETQLGTGEFFQFSMDFQLDSAPPIEFRRTYRSQYVPSQALGRGANDNYNAWLYSDGVDKLSFIDIIDHNGDRERLVRASPGKGFSPDVVFERNEDEGELLDKARLTWEVNHFKLQFHDGAWSTFLPCSDGRCYWSGYQDSTGHALRFERDLSLNLHRLTASDGQGVEFTSDSQYRLTSGKDTRGEQVSYSYDAQGRLARVTHADGQVTSYSYDGEHRLTSVSVISAPGASPVQILANEYDSDGHVSRQTLPGGEVVLLEYSKTLGKSRYDVKLTDPAGRILTLTRSSDFNYLVRASSVRFPPVVQPVVRSGQPKAP